jgi:hypothetical protein
LEDSSLISPIAATFPNGPPQNRIKKHLMKPTKKPTLLAFAVLATASVASASVTYVDASMLNTNISTGSTNDALWLDGNDGTTGGTIADGAANNDGLWRFRGSQGNGGIFEATGSTAEVEDAVEILTTITGLSDGTYNIYAFFLSSSASSDNWNIKAGLTTGLSASDVFRQNDTQSLTSGTLGIASSGLTFSGTPPEVLIGPRTLLYGLVGQAVVSGGGSVGVFIDDLPADASATRTWYDGVGYELVPEPSSSLLGALGALMLLRRRRD